MKIKYNLKSSTKTMNLYYCLLNQKGVVLVNILSKLGKELGRGESLLLSEKTLKNNAITSLDR